MTADSPLTPGSRLDAQALRRALSRRVPVVASAEERDGRGRFEGALRLCAGHVEGVGPVVVDRYASAVVVHDFSGPEGDRALLQACLAECQNAFPELDACVWKVRKSPDSLRRHGEVVLGDPKALPRFVREGDVRYSVTLAQLKDASFYLDTRNLRALLRGSCEGRSVLSTFAYTGSLGVAAAKAGARRVVQVDRNKAHLTTAKDSMARNLLPVSRADFIASDVFPWAARARREGALFDDVIVDAPFFSDTAAGRVDLVERTTELLGKLRPLVADAGRLIVVNNALFVSGQAFLASLEPLLAGGYATIESRIDVPDDCVGFAEPAGGPSGWPADPAPFRHPTKIVVVRMRRKDGRAAT